MNILYAKRFSKDLDAISHEPNIKKRLWDLIEQIKIADDLSNISGLKKIEGYPGYFRIRIGDYRLGIKVTEKVIEMIRFLHRKEIYRRFP
ncbi:MAG: type II toxin-antitoxin system RelE/ParE family toxin [Pseudomonadota bacterium]